MVVGQQQPSLEKTRRHYPSGPALQLALEAQRAALLDHKGSEGFLIDLPLLWGALVKHQCKQREEPAQSSPSSKTAATLSEQESVAESSGGAGGGDMVITYTGYRAAAYEVLFGPQSSSSSEETKETGENQGQQQLQRHQHGSGGGGGKELSDESQGVVYSAHPFLSPRTFLSFLSKEDLALVVKGMTVSTANSASSPNAAKKRRKYARNMGRKMAEDGEDATQREKDEEEVEAEKVAILDAQFSAITVPIIGVYSYIARKLLLYRMRSMLEICASVPPPALLRGTTSTPTNSSSNSSTASSSAIRCLPSKKSPFSCGLSEVDLEDFVSKILPNIRLARDMPSWFIPYYLCHCSRKLMMMLDGKGFGAVAVDTLMRSDVFSELLRLYDHDLSDAMIVFPVGCPVCISSSTIAASQTLTEEQKEGLLTSCVVTEDDTIECVVVSFDGVGCNPDDVYVLQPKAIVANDSDNIDGDDQDEEQQGIRNGESAGCNAKNRFPEVHIPRECVCWSCFQSDTALPEETLCYDNWFSLPLALRSYEQYSTLDVDHDGLLSLEEFSQFSNCSFSRLCVARVFEVHVPGEKRLMDFRTYLDFVLAMEYPGSPAGIRYFWKLLDIEGTKRYISVNVLRYFTKEVSELLIENGVMIDITADSVLSEVLDMVNPSWHEHITIQDLEKCGHASIVLPVMLNFRSFHAYDSREQMAAQQS